MPSHKNWKHLTSGNGRNYYPTKRLISARKNKDYIMNNKGSYKKIEMFQNTICWPSWYVLSTVLIAMDAQKGKRGNIHDLSSKLYWHVYKVSIKFLQIPQGHFVYPSTVLNFVLVYLGHFTVHKLQILTVSNLFTSGHEECVLTNKMAIAWVIWWVSSGINVLRLTRYIHTN